MTRSADLPSARLLIVGPQGSGKGTQGVRVGEALSIPVISTGVVFRANVSAGTPLGQQVKAIIEANGGIQQFFQKDLGPGFPIEPPPEQRRAKRVRAA